MAQGGAKGIRAKFADARDELARSVAPKDPPMGDAEQWGYHAGQWPGAPASRMPPNCPVVPLGRNDGVYYFFDSNGQLNSVKRSDFNKKTLLDLFARCPNYLYHHWPRWGAPKGGKPSQINGLEVDDCIQCLMKACAEVGIFSADDVVRGRGMWLTESGGLVWHAGEAIYRVQGKRLQASPLGMIEGVVYPGRAQVSVPWQEPVSPEDSPVKKIFELLQSWQWERPGLDPVLLIGWIGSAFLGAALPWRPALFLAGDKRVGKSTLQGLLRALFGKGLIKAANTTAAGIYQKVKMDVLPVSIDELEAKADDKRGPAIIELARLAASGDEMLRGGADHEGVSFTLRNVFAFSAINPPAMEPADKQRMIFLNLHKLKEIKAPGDLSLGADDGRMILRAVMDAWPHFEAKWKFWRESLLAAGFEDRGTYGVPLAIANLLLGDEALEKAGLHVADESNSIGKLVAEATAEERAEHGENWSDCVGHVLGTMIEAWKAGEKSTVGHALDIFERGAHDEHTLRSQLQSVGLGFKTEIVDGEVRVLLAIPTKTWPLVTKLFAGSKWGGGVWSHALKQGPGDVVIRDRGNGQNMKINRVTTRCLLVDLKAFDQAIGG
ncbi:hypothetical protein BA190_26810 [Labrys sp. WJW]|uniref:hypothetical protein n=1 Tax=Labrys sp. WJW TaxID=1737983 RepID=UPI00082B8711|nr:hypothetical protein [Labrys sp. WJW]OCC01826.1 hypothetical protein BA190_26810 [Labrys sp. WJW]